MQKNIENIMVLVDFSEASMNAVRTAVKMCRRHHARLHLLMIHNTEYLFSTAGMQAPVLNLSKEVVAAEIDNLQAYAASVQRNYGIECMPHHKTGWFITTIRQSAKAVDCDMFVIGSNPRTYRLLPYSRGYDILKAVNCPVLILRGTDVSHFKNIVLPLRPVPDILEKLSLTNTMARKNKASVHIVGAFDKTDVTSYSRLKMITGAVKQKMLNNRIPYSYEISFGKDTSASVLKACKEIPADLLVITASTLQSFRQAFSGNYAQKIINNAMIPVLCVKPVADTQKDTTAFMFSHSL